MGGWVGGWVIYLLGEREGSRGQAHFIQRKLGAMSGWVGRWMDDMGEWEGK